MKGWLPDVGPPWPPFWHAVPQHQRDQACIIGINRMVLTERQAWTLVDIYSSAELDQPAPPEKQLAPIFAQSLVARAHLAWAMRDPGWTRRPRA